MRYLLYTLLFTGIISPSFAQDNWTNKEGELEDSQIIIEKNRELELPKAQRTFQSVPEIKTTNDSIAVNYEWTEIIPSLANVRPSLRVLRIKSDPLEKLYANRVSVGLGNYGASYLSGYLSNKRDRDKSYGVQFYHKAFNSGSVDKNYSGSGYQFINPYAKLIRKNMVIKADLSYERANNYAYGQLEESADLNESFERKEFQKLYQKIGTSFQLADRNIENKFDYAYLVGASHFFTNENGNESVFKYDLDHSYQLNKNMTIRVPVDGYFAQYNNDINNTNRYLFRVKPMLDFKYDKLSVSAGLNIIGENDELPDMGKLHVYPNINAEYAINSKFLVNAGVSGNVEERLYQDFMRTNPLINAQPIVNSVLKPFELYTGFYANILNRVTLKGRASIASVLNQNYYLNASTVSAGDSSFYTYVNYFGENLAEANASLAMQVKFNKVFSLQTTGEYREFFSDEVSVFPHVPKFRWSLRADFNIREKFEIGITSIAQTKTQALLLDIGSSSSTITDYQIGSFMDLGVDLKYNLSERSTAFVTFNNLIAKEYSYYLNYPGRGFQAMVGFTYSF